MFSRETPLCSFCLFVVFFFSFNLFLAVASRRSLVPFGSFDYRWCIHLLRLVLRTAFFFLLSLYLAATDMLITPTSLLFPAELRSFMIVCYGAFWQKMQKTISNDYAFLPLELQESASMFLILCSSGMIYLIFLWGLKRLLFSRDDRKMHISLYLFYLKRRKRFSFLVYYFYRITLVTWRSDDMTDVMRFYLGKVSCKTCVTYFTAQWKHRSTVEFPSMPL